MKIMDLLRCGLLKVIWLVLINLYKRDGQILIRLHDWEEWWLFDKFIFSLPKKSTQNKNFLQAINLSSLRDILKKNFCHSTVLFRRLIIKNLYYLNSITAAAAAVYDKERNRTH